MVHEDPSLSTTPPPSLICPLFLNILHCHRQHRHHYHHCDHCPHCHCCHHLNVVTNNSTACHHYTACSPNTHTHTHTSAPHSLPSHTSTTRRPHVRHNLCKTISFVNGKRECERASKTLHVWQWMSVVEERESGLISWLFLLWLFC
jgi:hypothetical protein